jgi:hypothetical protein
MKYQSPSTYQSNDTAKFKIFNKQVKHQGHKVSFLGTHGNILLQGIFKMWYVKAIVPIIQTM